MTGGSSCSGMFLVDVYFGIYGNNRNPGDKKMAKKRKSSLHYNKVVYFTVVKKRERDYTLATGLYNPFER